MRMMLFVTFPTEKFNAAMRDGSLGGKLKRILETVKPEAIYFGGPPGAELRLDGRQDHQRGRRLAIGGAGLGRGLLRRRGGGEQKCQQAGGESRHVSSGPATYRRLRPESEGPLGSAGRRGRQQPRGGPGRATHCTGPCARQRGSRKRTTR